MANPLLKKAKDYGLNIDNPLTSKLKEENVKKETSNPLLDKAANQQSSKDNITLPASVYRSSSRGSSRNKTVPESNTSTSAGPVYSPAPQSSTTRIVAASAPNTSTPYGAVYSPAPQQEPIKKNTAFVVKTAPDGTRYLTAATKADNVNKPSAFNDFTRRFSQGLRVGSGIDGTRARQEASLEQTGNYDLAYSSGGFIGFFGPAKLLSNVPRVATAATTAAKSSQVAKNILATQAAQKVKTAYDLAQTNWFARNTISGVAGLAQAEGTRQTVKNIGSVTQNKEQKDLSKLPGFSSAYGEAIRAQNEAVRNQGFLMGLANELPFVGNYLDKGTFRNTFTESLKNSGASNMQVSDALKVAERQRSFASFGEASSLLAVSRKSEQIGRREVTLAFERNAATVPSKKVGWEMFKISAPQIATAGFVEGSVQEVTQQQSREMPFNFQDVGVMGLYGAGSAGLIGGGIVGTRVNKPAVSRTIEYATNIADPFEKPGDLLQDLAEYGTKKVTGKIPRAPVVTQTFSPDSFINLGATPAKSQSSKGKKGVSARSSVSSVVTIGSPVNIPTFTPTTIKTPAFSPTDTFTFGLGTPTPIPGPKTPVPSVGVPIITPVFAPVDTSTMVPVPVPVNVPINIPVNTPLLRVPPPVPFALDIPQGSSLGGARSRKGYFNELQASRNLFSELNAAPFMAYSLPVSNGRNKKSVSAKGKDSFFNFDFLGSLDSLNRGTAKSKKRKRSKR